MAMKLGALVLAGGKGTRMYSNLPKVLQPILGEPMLSYVHAALKPLFGDQIWTVIGHRADLLRLAFPQRRPLRPAGAATGHRPRPASRPGRPCARPVLPTFWWSAEMCP